MDPIQVSERDLDQFELAVFVACTQQSDERLEHELPVDADQGSLALPTYFTSEDGSLVMSFDAGWYPFLCNTRGYNLGPQRWYVPKVSKLIAHIAHALQSPIQRRVSYMPGGRVFLDANGVRRRPEGYGEMHVLQWRLPRESPFLP